MKGWPVARALLVLVILLLAGLPLRFLTRPKAAPAVATSRQPVGEKITVVVTFTVPPQSFSLTFLGNSILSGKNSPNFEVSTTFDGNFPLEGIDLVFEARWAENFKPRGALIQVIRADGSRQSQTVSGIKEIFEVLTFPGKAT